MDLDFRIVAEHIAADIIRAARASDTPVVWVTGNSYAPPLRSFPEAEALWQQDDEHGTAFLALGEEVDRLLGEANVFLSWPEWDNALYAVDLARWQRTDDGDDAEDLNAEWEPI